MTEIEHKISDTQDALKGLIELALELQAENQRLREALENIANLSPYSDDINSANVIACAALEGKS